MKTKEDVQVGDIVLYRHAQTKRDVPAIVLQDFGDGVVNLQVFFDHLNDLPIPSALGHFTPMDFWRTSVSYSSRNVAGTWHYKNEEVVVQEEN